jgi:hypothetical protein
MFHALCNACRRIRSDYRLGFLLRQSVTRALLMLLASFAAASAVAGNLTELPAPVVDAAAARSQERTGSDDRNNPILNRAKYNAADLSLEGTYGYVVSAGTVRIMADHVANRRPYGVSGTIKLELWAFAAPYNGSAGTGYKLGQTTLGTLSAGYQFSNVDQTVTQLTTLPNGTWYLSLIVTEYTASSVNSGYTPVDYGNFSTPWVIGAPPVTTVTVYELYSTSTNHYFRTSSAVEMQGIVNGSAGPGWIRTFDDFTAYQAQGGGPGNDVCRFYSFTSNSHFFTASDVECNSLKFSGGEWNYEGLAYRIQLPVNGICSAGLKPVYRLYNGRYMFHDSNHRFTTSFSEASRLSTPPNTWTYEGVAFCAVN